MTAIGRETVETLAALVLQHETDPQLGTMLSWALNEIRHDDPAAAVEALSQARDLLQRLARAEVPAVRRAAVEALGCLAAPQEADGQALLPLGPPRPWSRSAL